MKTLRFTAIALLTISLGFSGCGEKETPVEPTPEPTPEEVKSEITIDDDLIQNGLTFSCEAGEKSISFTTNEDWTLSIAETSSGETWCTASATSGTKGQANVKLSVTENTLYDNRSVSVTIVSGTVSKTFTITQKYTEALFSTKDKYEVAPEGGSIEIEINYTDGCTFTIAENAKDWIIYAPTRALGTWNCTFIIAANESGEKREGEIIFISLENDDKKETVTVYQEGNASTKVVTLEEAGTMRNLLGDNYLDIKSLKIVGPLNGDDIYYLRRMLGGDNFSQEDIGKLTTLDLSESLIVKGGGWYYETSDSNLSYYTADNTIGESMFTKCANLQKIILPDSVTSIDDFAFQGCPLLFSVSLPRGLTSIGLSAFEDCGALTNVHITDLTSWCNITMNDYTSNPLGSSYNGTGKLYLNNQELTELVIPDNVTEIKNYAFYNSNFAKITIGKNVTSIGDGSFSSCVGLSSVEILDNVRKIGARAFSNCTLESLIIGNGVTSIGEKAFSGCMLLKDVELGNNVTTIGYGAFLDCWELQSINLPNGIRTIEMITFAGCSSLKTVIIGNDVTTIQYGAFNRCDALTDFYCYTAVPPIIEEMEPFKTYGDSTTLYVPMRSASQYKNSDWSTYFKNIKEMD